MFFDGNMAAIIGYLDPAAADRRAGRGDVRVKIFWFNIVSGISRLFGRNRYESSDKQEQGTGDLLSGSQRFCV